MSNFVSTTYTSSTVLQLNHNRTYFAVYAVSDDVSFSFSNADNNIPLSAGQLYAPYACPKNQIFLAGSNFIVVEGES